MARTGIKVKLIRSFTIAILIPSLVLLVVGVLMIRQQVYQQAQVRVTSDLESAKEIYGNFVERLRDSLRIHATRMIVYGALDRRDPSALGPEMGRIRAAESLDMLSLADSGGRLFYCSVNPSRAGEDLSENALVKAVLRNRKPISGTLLVPEVELQAESADLAAKAYMEITPTPKAGPAGKKVETSGMMICAAAPVFTADGRFVGVLYGGTLLNRNPEIVDKIKTTVFKDEVYLGREVGTATIFQDDVRISTNVKNSDGSRAITTRVSAEVAREVLKRGNTWRGRAFVVNDWYISAYAPIRDLAGKIIGMLYVGTLERPYRHSLWRNLFVFTGIAALGVFIVGMVALVVAQRISKPIITIAKAARRISNGDYDTKVDVQSGDEIGFLAENFNRMVSELVGAHQELREWGENLEKKVEQRTAEVKAMQAHLVQSEKLAAVGKLAAGVAHEINNPLTGVLTNASLLLEDLPPEDPRREDLQTIVNETLRCRKIVKGLLDFARQTKPQIQSVDVNRIADDVLALVWNQASFRSIKIVTDFDTSCPQVMADGDQIRQVLLNIVLNAADAMASGGELRVTSRYAPSSKTVEVGIKDTGPGIPEDIQDKLFEPFFTTKKTGTGLGLAIAYGIMERHRGTIRVESEPGRGTVMTMVLPASGGGE